MRSLLAVAALALLAPSLAHAQVTMAVRDVPLHGARSLEAVAPKRFDMVGLHWRGGGSVLFRTRSSAGRWSAWQPAAPEGEDGPDTGSPEARRAGAWHLGNPYWTGDANAIAYRLRGSVTRLRAYFVESPVDGLPPRSLSIAGSPQIIPRSAWGADESIRRAPPQYADALHFAVVHHTAGTNSYSPSQSAAIVRGIEIYHVKGNGWNDIGYNFLVDRYGQVFEGRYGGIDANVIGAHAQGFNTGSVGVAVIGSYGSAAPPAAAQDALASLLAWRLDVAHVDPLSHVTVTSGGNPRFAAGVPVLLRAISGHRDAGFTSCPGSALYARLGAIAAKVGATGLPKLYAPTVTGTLGGPVEFKATLTDALPWTVSVSDPAGTVVATGSGTGPQVDWTWDATVVPRGRYAWTIDAGPDVLPATGFVGAAPVPLALKSPSAKPVTISPGASGIGDRSTVSYTLTTAATVTASLRASTGQVLGTLFTGRRPKGRNTFVFTANGVAEGRYEILLSATDGTSTVTATIPVSIDGTLSALSLSSAAFSPNGDGRKDSLGVSVGLSRQATLRVDVRQRGRLLETLASGSFAPGSQVFTWDGTTAAGPAPDGTYTATVTTVSSVAKTTRTLTFGLDTIAPSVRAISYRRLRFQISEAARVTAVVNGRVVVRDVRAGLFSLPVVRRLRRVRLSAVDPAGNVSRTLRWP
jgi:N-acetylmuramoyl-L-alanine amidase-like protein/flagellar hook capping protein FlgD